MEKEVCDVCLHRVGVIGGDHAPNCPERRDLCDYCEREETNHAPDCPTVVGFERCEICQQGVLAHAPNCPESSPQPEQCWRCHGEIDSSQATKLITVDDDPGDGEVGPQPDIIEVVVHVDCPCDHEPARSRDGDGVFCARCGINMG